MSDEGPGIRMGRRLLIHGGDMHDGLRVGDGGDVAVVGGGTHLLQDGLEQLRVHVVR